MPIGPFAVRYQGPSYGMDHALFDGLESSLLHLAANDPAACDAALAMLAAHEVDDLRFLVCRVLTVRGDADAAIHWLISDHRHFLLGWADSPRWAARELIQAWSPTCSQQALDALENALLRYRAPFETRGSFGRTQHELLSGVALGRLSVEGRRRLAELERRYPPPQAPRPIEAYVVGPPITEDAASRMSDEHWIGALRTHDAEEGRFDDDLRLIGGSGELAMLLGRYAEAEPERFARLALRFDASIPAPAIDNVVRSIAGKVEVDLLTDVCEHARDLYGSAVGRSICWAVGDGAAVGARLVALLAVCAEDPDPIGASSAAGGGRDLLMAGMSCTRGAAAQAVARVLFVSGEHVDVLLPVVARLATDEVPEVRVMAAEAVLALLNHQRQRALEMALRLFDDPTAVLLARPTARLLQHAVARAPETFAPVLRECLRADGECGRHAGLVWAATVLHAELPSDVVADVTALPVDARRGAAEVFASDPGAALTHLEILADDADEEVLSSVARAARHLERLDDQQAEDLIAILLSGRAGDRSLQPLISIVKRSPQLPTAALEACEMAVASAGADVSDIRSAHAALAPDVLAVVLRLYRSGNEDVRSRCLDVVDRLSEAGAYGLTDALAAER